MPLEVLSTLQEFSDYHATSAEQIHAAQITAEEIIESPMKDQASADYQLLVDTYRRDRAARIWQARYLEKQQPTDVRLQRIAEFLKSNKLLRDPHDEVFNEHVRECVQNNRYDFIDYTHANFTRLLYSTLKVGVITMNEMMTVKFLYDALRCFYSDTIANDPSSILSRFQLSDSSGPYQPRTHIDYWGDKEQETLQSKLTDETISSKLHYYTIDIPLRQTLAFIIMKLNSQRNIASVRKAYVDYIATLDQNIDEDTKKTVLTKLNSNPPDFDYLIRFIFAAEGDWFEQMYMQTPKAELYNPRMQTIDAKLTQDVWLQERWTALFMEALDNVQSQMPMLCQSPHYNQDDLSTPIVSFVLPTIDTLNALQSILHENEAVFPIANLGQLSVAHIRAFDELPVMSKSLSQPVTLSSVQQRLKTIYPSANRLEHSSRPIELTHPDIQSNKHPHEVDVCSDFLLSWHDVFHAWRSGSNYKGFIRQLRLLHDEKGGFIGKQGSKVMSDNIWKLTDMDFSEGHYFRDKNNTKSWQMACNMLMILGKTGGFDFDNDVDNNYLYPYSLCKTPERWDPLPTADSLNSATDYFDIVQSDGSVHHHRHVSSDSDPLPRLDKIHALKKHIEDYLSNHPDASVVEIILHDLLAVNETPSQQAQVQEIELKLKAIDLKDIFYWSNKKDAEGLMFKQHICQQCNFATLNINPILRQNSKHHICVALTAIIQLYLSDAATLNRSKTQVNAPGSTSSVKALQSLEFTKKRRSHDVLTSNKKKLNPNIPIKYFLRSSC